MSLHQNMHGGKHVADPANTAMESVGTSYLLYILVMHDMIQTETAPIPTGPAGRKLRAAAGLPPASFCS